MDYHIKLYCRYPIIKNHVYKSVNKTINISYSYLRCRTGIRFSTTKYKSKFNKSLKRIASDTIESEKYITNLSSKQLTETQQKVLAKGLSFVPSRTINTVALNESVSRFERSNRLKYFFRNRPPQEPHPFKPKSTWQPPKASPELEAYLSRIKTDISKLPPQKIYPNLSKLEHIALKELATDPTIVIKSADKGSGIVVEDTQNYIKDGLEHLAEETIYNKIDSDPTLPLAEGKQYVTQMYNKGTIDSITKEYLLFKEDNLPRTQQLYFLKKIHKNPIAVRPIVSGCGGPTEKVSQLVDLQLQSFVPKVNSYIRDSGHLIHLLEQLTIPTNCILATIDVKALYLNIPHAEGIESVLNRAYYKNKDADKMTMPPGTMSDLLLTKNHFQFADSMYHQIQGTAMGTKIAPAYANNFMAELEEKLLENYPTKPILWKRYIDDVLCIWPGKQEDLDTFIKYLNRSHPTIKFTYESSTTSVDFLDITIYKGDRYISQNKLDIKPYFKKNNKFQYLEYNSAHPRTTFAREK